MKNTLLALVLLLTSFTLSHAATDVVGLVKNDLVRYESGKVVPVDGAKLAGVKYFAFYYSAHWCPPCRKFTPELVKFYNRFKAEHANFELVFVSSDRSAADMTKYMHEASMPWPAIAFDKAESHAVSKYCGPGIPCLVLMDAQGKILSDSFAGNQYLGPDKVMTDIQLMVK